MRVPRPEAACMGHAHAPSGTGPCVRPCHAGVQGGLARLAQLEQRADVEAGRRARPAAGVEEVAGCERHAQHQRQYLACAHLQNMNIY